MSGLLIPGERGSGAPGGGDRPPERPGLHSFRGCLRASPLPQQRPRTWRKVTARETTLCACVIQRSRRRHTAATQEGRGQVLDGRRHWVQACAVGPVAPESAIEPWKQGKGADVKLFAQAH